MTKVVVLLYRRPDLTREAFRVYWRDVHGPLGAAMPGIRRYVQNRPAMENAPFDGMAEMWFDSTEAMQIAFTSPEAAKAAADVPNFLDRTEIVLVEEVAVVDGG